MRIIKEIRLLLSWFLGNDCTGSIFKGHIYLINARILKYCLISFITFQGIVATIKEKEYNFLDQRKMDFEQDYEEFCKQTNDLHVGWIMKLLLTVWCLFFPFCVMLVIITHSEGSSSWRWPIASLACILWFQINDWRLFFMVINIALGNDLWSQTSACVPS